MLGVAWVCVHLHSLLGSVLFSWVFALGSEVAELVAELLECGVHPGFDGAEGDFEGFGDLFVGEVLVLVEDEDGAQLGGELLDGVADALGEFLSVEFVFGVGGVTFEAVFEGLCGVLVFGLERDEESFAWAAQRVDADVVGDAVGPG